jgi:acylphosphatase
VIRVLIRYQGRVQGVGFRATTRSIARAHPVTGWVRNEADGSVSLLAEGSADDVERFLQAIRDRMERFVTAEERHPSIPTGEFREFEIRR